MHRWYAVTLEVGGVPAGAAFVPASVEIDLSALAPGADERAVRLFRLDTGGRETEVAWQFSPFPQARRPGAGTPPGVSWTAQWAAGEERSVPVAGTLTFDAAGGGGFRLEVGVPAAGTAVQVPFPPGNLRCFEPGGRPTPVHWFPEMHLRPQWPRDGVLHLLRGRTPLADYHLGAGALRPYLYPVYGPDGDVLTGLGKPHDPTGSHAHHCSLWIAHASVGGVDFWSERGGSIRHEACADAEDGPLFLRLVQDLAWKAADRVLLRERRVLTAWHTPEAFGLIDFDLELRPGDGPVELGQTPFGLLAARVAPSLTVFDGAGAIENAEGYRNEQHAHRRRSRWIDQSGPVAAGRWNGLALLDHPDNPGYPVRWHCRNDGWAGASITADGPMGLAAEAPLRLRYRVHLHRGDAAAGEVERRHGEFVCRPTVAIGSLRELGGG